MKGVTKLQMRPVQLRAEQDRAKLQSKGAAEAALGPHAADAALGSDAHVAGLGSDAPNAGLAPNVLNGWMDPDAPGAAFFPAPAAVTTSEAPIVNVQVPALATTHAEHSQGLPTQHPISRSASTTDTAGPSMQSKAEPETVTETAHAAKKRRFVSPLQTP